MRTEILQDTQLVSADCVVWGKSTHTVSEVKSNAAVEEKQRLFFFFNMDTTQICINR